MKIVFLERKFKIEKLDAFAIFRIPAFPVWFCLIGLVVPWKEFVNFCVYLILFLITSVLLFLNLLLKRTGLSNTQTYYEEKQNLRFLITGLIIHKQLVNHT